MIVVSEPVHIREILVDVLDAFERTVELRNVAPQSAPVVRSQPVDNLGGPQRLAASLGLPLGGQVS